jgi:site-specific DNA recombinase
MQMRTLDVKEVQRLNKMLKNNKQKGVDYLRVAIYARKSAEDEKDTSLSTQIDQCKEVISRYEFMKLTNIFKEDNASGMFIAGRTEYQRMMTMAENKEIDVIIVMKLDRLARDLVDCSTTVKLLGHYGCHLIAGDDISDPNTPTGEFIRSIVMAQGQLHARRVASDVMATECKNAKDGKSAGGIAPYGLKLVNQRFEINEDEAPAIRILFEKFVSGASYAQISEELLKLGYTTRSGGKFSYSTLIDMLKNDKYYGTYVYNREDGKRRKNRVLNEHFDEVRNSNAIKPIISKDLFDKASKLLESRTSCAPRQKNNPSFVLTGKIVCKQCGKSMCGETQTCGTKKKRRRIYQCPNHTSRNGNHCSTKAINADYLENSIKSLILNSVNQHLSGASKDDIIAPAKKKLEDEMRYLSRHISDTEKKADRMLERATKTNSEIVVKKYETQAEEFYVTANRYKENLKELDTKLKSIDVLKSTPTVLTESVVFTSHDRFRELVYLYIEKIEIDDASDDVNVIFNT